MQYSNFTRQTTRIYHRSPMQAEKPQPSDKLLMPEKLVRRSGTKSLPSTNAPHDHPYKRHLPLLQRSKTDLNPHLKWGGGGGGGGGGGRVVGRRWINFQCRAVLLIWIIVGQGPIALAKGAGGGCLDIFSLNYHFSFLSPSLWETVRYRLKYCLKGPLNPEQPTNQRILKGE